ncbi:MAG: glycosyltransferase [Bacteroidales bacterium]|nr:glycosyltransferase [Bacteroidales bacterium]
MRIVILGTAHPFRGGLAAYNERLARELQKEGHIVMIFTFTVQYPGFLFPGKTQYTDAPSPSDLSVRRILNSVNPFNWVKTAREVSKYKPDIVLIKYWHPFMAPCLGTVAWLAKRNKKVKTIIISIFDNVIPHERKPGDNLLTKYFTGKIDGAIVMSGSVANDLRKFNLKAPVLYNPHPLYDNYGDLLSREYALSKLGLPEDYYYLLFFGFIRAYKGLDLLLEAINYPHVRNLKIKLIVAGEFYEDRNPYDELIRKHNLQGMIAMYDRYISENEVNLFFSAADLVVQPYRNATQSGVTQIAFHFEKPMLVTDVGGLSEIVPDKKCGFVVRPDPAEVADAIADYFKNNRKPIFTEEVKKEKQKYGWDKLTATIYELYEKIK